MAITPCFWADVLIIGFLALVGGHAWCMFQARRWLLLDPLNAFWVGLFFCYIMQPIVGAELFLSWHPESVFVKTLAALLLGSVCVVVGYEAKLGRVTAQVIPVPPASLSPSKLLISAIVLICLGLIGYWYVIRMSGGFNEWFSVGRGGTDLARVQGYLPELTHGVAGGVLLLLFRANSQKISDAGKLIAWTAAGLLWVWFLYLGSRSRLIALSIFLCAMYYLPSRKNPRPLVALALLAVLFVAVTFQDYRESFTNLSFNVDSIDKREFLGKLLPEFLGGSSSAKVSKVTHGSEFNCAMAVIELVPEKVPYNYGYGFLEIITRPIPRSLWPGKRHPHMESVQGVLREGDLSAAFVQTSENQDLLMGPAFCFVGHWYYVGGFIGLSLGGLLTGVLLRVIRAYFDLNEKNQGVTLLYPLLISIGFFEAAFTPLYWVFFSLPFLLFPLIVILALCRAPEALKHAASRSSLCRKQRDRALRVSNLPLETSRPAVQKANQSQYFTQ